MEIQLPVHAVLKQGYIVLKHTCKADYDLAVNLFNKKTEWERRNGREFYLQARLGLRYQKRTYKQNSTVWELVTVIFQSMSDNRRKPTEEEKYDLYYDLLEVYADKTPNRLTGGLRPVHISESNSVEGARFIDGLLAHLATACELDYHAQSEVQDILQQWEAWRGGLADDPLDYADIGCTRPLTEKEWREKHPYSEASGRGGAIVRAHIVSRGSDAADIGESWNWMALLWEEHEKQHEIGWGAFLQIYPHLRGRAERARRLAGRLDLKPPPKTAADLADEALGEE
jgi:hypothetical protein